MLPMSKASVSVYQPQPEWYRLQRVSDAVGVILYRCVVCGALQGSRTEARLACTVKGEGTLSDAMPAKPASVSAFSKITAIVSVRKIISSSSGHSGSSSAVRQ